MRMAVINGAGLLEALASRPVPALVVFGLWAWVLFTIFVLKTLPLKFGAQES
jgi:hypothetical protein